MKDFNSTSTYMAENGIMFFPGEEKFVVAIKIDLTLFYRLWQKLAKLIK